ncbi:MAG: L-seryl-tRNA(Sec) selenium transferase [Deltaproteobacteria bacterium]|jgi:L-seryl-tRNA(Ser) seleniumtransferase|nr:L-seryl-tRNA(Sec) selenium transferase [Deltaproteobacteria bacterium]
MPAPDRLRQIPSITSLLARGEIRSLLARYPRAVVLGAMRRLLDVYRGEALREKGSGRSREEWTSLLLSALPDAITADEGGSLRKVINATGIVVHTNLGRAPLPGDAIRAIVDVASGYSNLEFDLTGGTRSRRLAHVEEALLELTGAESVHVVNNNAAAVFLCLAALAKGRDVIVSRGELVEIGGSFRIPEILAASGANLVEVGTTNRTRQADYERAAGPSTALLLKVHRSNFHVTGFTEEVQTADLVVLGEKLGIPVMEDLGSGAVFDFGAAGIPGTPTVKQALGRGPGIVTVSGDKLLGGPQAGIIAGRKDLVEPLKTHPLSRALRLDKLCLAALAATLRLYADERRATACVPVLGMILEGEGITRARARKLIARVRREQARSAIRDGASPAEHRPASGSARPEGGGLKMQVERSFSSPGGGAMPEIEIPTACVALSHVRVRVEELDAMLRSGKPPVVGRISKGRLLLDMRTVRDEELPGLAAAVVTAARSRTTGND